MPKPKEIDFGFVHVDEKTWGLDLPSEEISIKELESNLDIAYLEKEGTDDWNLTLRELIESPEENLGHYKKIMNADMSYPIHIFLFNGSWRILDGVHRLCKAVMEKRNKMWVRKVPPELIPKILKD